jgi:hypothetical protein
MYRVNYKQNETGEKFPYIDIGSEDHGRKSFRLWVSHKLITKEDEKEIIKFPCNAEIIQTEKGTLVMRPSENYIVHNIHVECGYRGGAEFEILEPKDVKVYEYRFFHSPRGNCGISRGALVVVPRGSVLKYRWARSGRTYGSPKRGIRIVFEDGKEENFEDIADGLDELDKIKEMLK